jgi:hypothetical protein
MFEVIISMVRTGRVERKLFDTREEADRHAEDRMSRWLEPKGRSGKNRSARDLRVEVVFRDLPAIHKLRPAASARSAVA